MSIFSLKAYYTTSIELDPKFAEAYHNRGNTYLNLGETELGIADLQQAEQLFSRQGKQEESQQIKDLLPALTDPKYL